MATKCPYHGGTHCTAPYAMRADAMCMKCNLVSIAQYEEQEEARLEALEIRREMKERGKG